MTIANYVTLVTGVILIILILMQTRGASLGAGLGGSGDVNTVRRGSERTLHNITSFLVVVFSVSLLVNIILA